MHLEERKLKEIEHSDRRRQIVRANEYCTDASADQLDTTDVESNEDYQKHFSNMKFYSVAKSSFAYRDKLVLEGIEGAVALDYCCGNGEMAVRMAKAGAKKVYGIDISSVAVENAAELAKREGVGDRCEFKVMDAENTEFADGTFDLIHEYGALHHLDLKAAYAELSRITKPGGKLIATETLRHNPLIHWYRKRTPHLRTAWEVEHILGFPEIKGGKKFFNAMELRPFHLAVLAAVPFRKTPLFAPLRSLLEVVDRVILSIPFVERLAWIAVIKYSRPM